MNYPEKRIIMHPTENYKIDNNKITYTKLNEIQTEDLAVGTVKYQVEYGENITVDEDGNIVANALGTAKVKITDIDNNYSTYIIIDVIEDITNTQLESGIDFTIALKGNGTVWSYGNNANGALGIGDNTNSNKPVQVMTEEKLVLENIVDIGAGTTGAIAVNKDGEVYTWGQCYQNTTANNVLLATKIPNLTNIKKVSSKDNCFYAIDKNGSIYVWGKGYNEPTKIETAVKIVETDGELLLGENGKVYSINNPKTAIPFLSNIGDVASGEDHKQFVTLEGHVYSMGTRKSRTTWKQKYTK